MYWLIWFNQGREVSIQKTTHLACWGSSGCLPIPVLPFFQQPVTLARQVATWGEHVSQPPLEPGIVLWVSPVRGKLKCGVKLLERWVQGADPEGGTALFSVLLLLLSVACSGNVMAGMWQPPFTTRMEACPYTHHEEQKDDGGQARTVISLTDITYMCFSLRQG